MGTWKIVGAHRETGAAETLTLQAADQADAEAIASRLGLLVSEIQPVAVEPQRRRRRGTSISVLGIALGLFGLISLVQAFAMDQTGLDGKTINLGRLQDQMMNLHLGATLCICGCILLGCGRVFSAVIASAR